MNRTYNIIYYSNIGFINENPKQWFPVFDEYPNIENKQLLLYDEKNSNIAIQNWINLEF